MKKISRREKRNQGPRGEVLVKYEIKNFGLHSFSHQRSIQAHVKSASPRPGPNISDVGKFTEAMCTPFTEQLESGIMYPTIEIESMG